MCVSAKSRDRVKRKKANCLNLSPAFWNVTFFSFESLTRKVAQAHENAVLVGPQYSQSDLPRVSWFKLLKNGQEQEEERNITYILQYTILISNMISFINNPWNNPE